jgi:hypothetical protein
MRDCELIKRRDITAGLFYAFAQGTAKFRQILERLDLGRSGRTLAL